MARKNNTEDRVILFIPTNPNSPNEQPVVVGVQGKLYNIPIGKSVSVPREVYDEYMRSNAAAVQARDYILGNSIDTSKAAQVYL